MKKVISVIFVMLLVTIMPVAMWAQMSDNQVMSYAAKELKKGTSQQEIALNLLEKGATMEQLQRLAKKGASSSLSSSTSRSKSTGGNSRLHEERDDSSDGFFDSDSDFEVLVGALMNVAHGPESRIFGHSIFSNRLLSFEPNMNVATPNSYVLGVGDMVFVDVYGVSQESFEGEISADGKLFIEDYGPVKLAGLTVRQATAHLKSTLGQRYENSEIEISVGQTRTIKVNVMGEVKAPGTYTLSAFATAFHALYCAGGVTPIGTLRDIKVYRSGRLVSTIDVYDYILKGQLSGDVRLEDNDVIVIGPYSCLATVGGFVKRPMTYEMKPTESVSQLLEYAGGLRNDAYSKNMRLFRNQDGAKGVFNIDASNIAQFRVADGDSVAVDSMLNRFRNMVEVRGAVFRPGQYQVGGNILTVKQLIQYADGLTEDAFTARAIMHRMRDDRTQEVIRLDIDGIMSGIKPDVTLQNEDVVFIPSLHEARLEKTFTIHGEVRHPGVFPFAHGTTIEDMILQAGGLRDGASTAKIDVARRINDQGALERNSERAKTYTFSLKDGYVVDGADDFILEPYDQIYVRKSPGFEHLANVQVDGEVMFAGTYTLNTQNERLSSVINKAGGVTSFGHAHGARLMRRMTPEEKQMLKLIKQQADTAYSTNLEKMLIDGDYYYVGIDLAKAIAQPGSDYDVVLEEGDRIIVPRYENTVTVNGEVMLPTSTAYIAGKSVKYYISKAGGYGLNAKRSRAYIVYQNGQVGEVRDGAKVEPGCEIIVPMKVSKSGAFSNPMMWMTMGSSLATIAAVLISALK